MVLVKPIDGALHQGMTLDFDGMRTEQSKCVCERERVRNRKLEQERLKVCGRQKERKREKERGRERRRGVQYLMLQNSLMTVLLCL